MTTTYEIREVPSGVAVVNTTNGEIVNVWNPANRVMAVQFADALNTLINMAKN